MKNIPYKTINKQGKSKLIISKYYFVKFQNIKKLFMTKIRVYLYFDWVVVIKENSYQIFEAKVSQHKFFFFFNVVCPSCFYFAQSLKKLGKWKLILYQ